MALLPFIAIILSLIYWAIAALVRKRISYLKQQLVSTTIIVMSLIHPGLVKTMISLFSCTEIDSGEWWLTDE